MLFAEDGHVSVFLGIQGYSLQRAIHELTSANMICILRKEKYATSFIFLSS